MKKSIFSAFCLLTLAFPNFAHAKMTHFEKIQMTIRILDLAFNGLYSKYPYPQANEIFLKQSPEIFRLESSKLNDLVQLGLSFYDLYSLSKIHHHSHIPVLELYHRYHQGQGWGVIAQSLGMHPGDFNQSRVGVTREKKIIYVEKKKPGKWAKFKSKFKKKDDHKHKKENGHSKQAHRHKHQ